MNELAKKKVAERFQFIDKLYKKSNGVDGIYHEYTSIGKELGFDKWLSNDICRYLKLEGLISSKSGLRVALTHKAVKEYESATMNPSDSTEHFPSGVQYIINVDGNIQNSQIQQATKNSTQKQSIKIENSTEIIQVLEEILQNVDEYDLNEDDKNELIADITTANTQLSSPRPKRSIVNESLKSVKNILEGAAGSILAQQILGELSKLI